MYADMKKGYKIWISQKMQKGKVLEEPVCYKLKTLGLVKQMNLVLG